MAEDPESKIVEFIRIMVEKAGADGAILGLSGGIDSAVTAFLGARAIGPERVLAILMPEKGVTPQGDMEDAREVAKILGIEEREIDIAPILKCYSQILPLGQAPRVVAGNLKARVRMTLLYWHANLMNSLVLGTGNKTEVMLGYSTKHGDAAVDILPLGGLYKKDVRAMAERLGVPRRIIDKKPTAGLWPGQTDEGEMGISYQDADGILEGLEKGRSRENLSEAYGREKVDLILERIRRSQHKRELPAMPGDNR